MDVLSTGPRRQGGRAAEHSQLPSDHAWGEGLCVCGRGPGHRQTVIAAEWSLYKVWGDLWASVTAHLNEWGCESASAQWQHEIWCNNEVNTMYSSASYTSEAPPAPTSFTQPYNVKPLFLSPSDILHLYYSSFSPPQDENIHDVLQLLVALMSEHPASMIPAFDQRNGIRWLNDLMSHEKLISLLNIL